MNDYLPRLAGTLLGFFRIGSLRLKDGEGALVLRNAGDTAHVGLEVARLKVTTGAASGKVLTSDAGGAATWQAAGTVLDGASITGTRTEGSHLVFNGAADWVFTGDSRIEGPQDDSITGGEIETGQEMKVTVNGTQKLRITGITCVLDRSRVWWVELWNASKTTKLAESAPWTLWNGGRTVHQFPLTSPIDVEPGDVFYIRLWCDMWSYVHYLNSAADIVGDYFTFSTAGCKGSDAFYCPAQITFIPGTAQGGWEYHSDTFTDLTDTPADYTGQGGNLVAVKKNESGLEFVSPSGGAVAAVYRVRATQWTTENPDPADYTSINGLSLTFTLEAAADVLFTVTTLKSSDHPDWIRVYDGSTALVPGQRDVDAGESMYCGSFTLFAPLSEGEHTCTVKHAAAGAANPITWRERCFIVQVLA